MRALVLTAVLLAITPALAKDLYLFDLLKQRSYRRAWDQLLEGEQQVPGWLVTFSRTSNGPAQPSKLVDMGGTQFRVADVCQPHDCGDNALVVAFSPGAQRAWGRLKVDGRFRFLGMPDPVVRQVLEAGL